MICLIKLLLPFECDRVFQAVGLRKPSCILSSRFSDEIQDEDYAQKALKVAEKKVKYLQENVKTGK